MNLFLAAIYTNSCMPGQEQHARMNPTEQGVLASLPNILESYHYIGKQKYVDQIRANGGKVFLDSGAFSAHSLGVSIDINAYCDYIKQNLDILRIEDGAVMASVLDGIGDPLKTYQNQVYMESQGAKPLPCFHFGEDPRYLEHYVKNYSYITIGGLVGRSKKDAQTWLDRMWNLHMVDGSGRPRLKVHAFGMTSVDLMKRYPWYSVDSSSWVQAGSFGSIFTSEFGPISVSTESPSKHVAGRHITTLSDVERKFVEKMLTDKGFDYERLSTIYQSRWAYNCLGYTEVNKIINDHASDSRGKFEVSKTIELF